MAWMTVQVFGDSDLVFCREHAVPTRLRVMKDSANPEATPDEPDACTKNSTLLQILRCRATMSIKGPSYRMFDQMATL
jgi:hypothetical protein